MYKLKCTIKCPKDAKDEMLQALSQCPVEHVDVQEVDYATFIDESRLYWDYVYPEMKDDKLPVTYLTFMFDDTPQGREDCHNTELKIGWIPLNIRYVEV